MLDGVLLLGYLGSLYPPRARPTALFPMASVRRGAMLGKGKTAERASKAQWAGLGCQKLDFI